MKRIPLAIQLYTVREDLKQDFKGVLKALADLGYQGVEFAGNYGGMKADELGAFLKSLGLACCGIHAPLAQVLDPDSETYAYAKGLRSPFVTTSLAGEVAKDWLGTIPKVQKAGETARAAGVTFTYHNHAQEFQKIEGKYALDLLFEKTTPDAVKAQLDTYWIKKGGADPVPYIRKYAGRVPQVHLKDMDPSDQSFTEVGAGLMDLPAIFAAAADAGARWIIYEQDTCKRPRLESARISIENLRKAGLV